MKKTLAVINLVLVSALFAGLGCASLHKSDSTALQGTWKGEEVGEHKQGPCYLIIAGQTLEFRGADTNEWYKGNFTLREETKPPQLIGEIKECPFPQYNGKTVHAIYRIAEGTLTLTGNEPGNPEAPASFDAVGARHFVFKKQ